MSYTSDTKFQCGKETCAYIFLNLIKFSPKFLKDDSLLLKGFIHEINELEVSMLLRSYGFSDLANIVLYRHTKASRSLLESKPSNDYTFDIHLVSHLLSPYGYCCLIGIKENTLEW